MPENSWFQHLNDKYKDDFVFKLEGKILELTEEICKAMKISGISKSDLARKMGTSPAAVSKLLQGNSNFTLKTLMKLSECLGHDLMIGFHKKSKFNIEGAESIIWISSNDTGSSLSQSEESDKDHKCDADSVSPALH